jgi:uncharacterized lipoprotein YbaY/heat shock protein HslJ
MSNVDRSQWLAAATMAVVLGLFGATTAAALTVTGTATWRERMLLPPGASFEATVVDISIADAPASAIARTRHDAPQAPPISFAMEVDPTRLLPGHRYAVRATITLDGRLLFTTDTVQSVLGPDGRTHVDLLMRRVAAAAAPAASTAAGPQRLRGHYSHFADAGRFVDCRSGRSLAVAQEGANAELEAAYGRARTSPGAPVLVRIDGRIESRPAPEGGRTAEVLVVEGFADMQAGRGCDGAPAATYALENTYWKLLQLGSTVMAPDSTAREPHFVLQAMQRRVVGSGGCNRLTGSYTLDGPTLRFERFAGTMMACPKGMDIEKRLLDALALVQGWFIDGPVLSLSDAQGTVIARFEARVMK